MSEDVKQQMVAILPRLRRFGYALTGSIDDGDDLVQGACERALSRLHQWQRGTRLDSWMYRIMQNLWIDQIRARKVRGYPEDPAALETIAGTDGRRVTESSLMLETVRQAVNQLPEEQRVVFALVAVEGHSYCEAAEVLDVPKGTIMSRLSRARRRVMELTLESAVG